MSKKNGSLVRDGSPRWFRGKEVPKAAIRRFAQQVAERFEPDKIILFGSHAYGKPHAESDVDILVVMPARNQLEQAFKIRLAVYAPFGLDLIVRTPHNLQWRLAEQESFHTEIMSKGHVLYEKGNPRGARQSRRRLPGRESAGAS